MSNQGRLGDWSSQSWMKNYRLGRGTCPRHAASAFFCRSLVADLPPPLRGGNLKLLHIVRPPPILINGKRLGGPKVERVEARPAILSRRFSQASVKRIIVNIVNLLPDHPITPKRESFEAILPDLMVGAVRRWPFN